MACNCIRNCQLCNNLVISQAVTYEAAGDVLEINIPQRNFNNCSKCCLIVAQSIPTETTIDAPVEITIGDVADVTYPLVTRDGVPIYATQLRTRRIYPLRVRTTPTGGVFVFTGNCLPSSNVTVNDSIPVATATVTTDTDTTKVDNAQVVQTNAIRAGAKING